MRVGRSVTTYPDLEVPVPLLGAGYQGRRASDTLPPTRPNSDPRCVLQGSLIASSARAGAKQARSSRAKPCRCQRGTAGTFLLRQLGGAELTPSVPIAQRGVNCRAWHRRLIACRSAIHWLNCDLSQAAVTVPHGNLAIWLGKYGRLAFACGRASRLYLQRIAISAVLDNSGDHRWSRPIGWLRRRNVGFVGAAISIVTSTVNHCPLQDLPDFQGACVLSTCQRSDSSLCGSPGLCASFE